MADLSKIIEKKAESAQYMVDEITHICKNLPKRAPGSEGEKAACEYMAEILKKDCGCERADVEPFKLNPGSFYGWIYITITCVLLGLAALFFLPVLTIVLIGVGLVIMVLQFGLYKKLVDFLFPEKTSHNVTAIKKCTGEVRGRIFFNGHPDAAWNWPVNQHFGGIAFEAHNLVSILGAIYIWILSMAAVARYSAGFHVLTPESRGLFWCAISSLIFVPALVGMYFMWDKKKTVDGANDNLSGCYIGIAILKAMKDAGIELEHTEVGVILSGSEEAGLRGAKAWCQAHKGEFDDVPTWIYSFDTIHDKKYLMVNYRDLNSSVKSDKEVCDSFMDAAKELGIRCSKGFVPPLGGATDSAAFAQAGMKSAGITGLNHALESYYHTIYDSYDNMDKEGLADCFAVAVKCLENFDKNR
jgi:hypothetical protein